MADENGVIFIFCYDIKLSILPHCNCIYDINTCNLIKYTKQQIINVPTTSYFV